MMKNKLRPRHISILKITCLETRKAFDEEFKALIDKYESEEHDKMVCVLYDVDYCMEMLLTKEQLDSIAEKVKKASEHTKFFSYRFFHYFRQLRSWLDWIPKWRDA